MTLKFPEELPTKTFALSPYMHYNLLNSGLPEGKRRNCKKDCFPGFGPDGRASKHSAVDSLPVCPGCIAGVGRVSKRCEENQQNKRR